MKRVSGDDKVMVFTLGKREHGALIKLLRSYPVVPPAHHSLSKESIEAAITESQRLLDEALGEQRAVNKSHVETWLADSGRFHKAKSGYSFTLEVSDAEWLLQVLNDIRVGNWLRLGSPEGLELDPASIRFKQLATWMAMQMSGYFQTTILEALQNGR